MLWYQALLLGVVQGLTEFLPISSSGHLVIIPILLGWQSQPLVFDLILHLGTAAALITYFRNDIKSILLSLNKELSKEHVNAHKYPYESKLGVFIILGSIPAVVLGYMFNDIVEAEFRGLLTVALLLLCGSLLMFYAELKMRKSQFSNSFKEVNGIRALGIGLFQTLALLPGVSRSGATISGGMILGLTREYAARFSFLLSIPIVLGATLFKVLDAPDAELANVGLVAILIGFVSSFTVGYLAIDLLLKFLKSKGLMVFIVYRVLLAFVLLAVYFQFVPVPSL